MLRDEIDNLRDIKMAIEFISSAIYVDDSNSHKEASFILDLLIKELEKSLKNLQQLKEI